MLTRIAPPQPAGTPMMNYMSPLRNLPGSTRAEILLRRIERPRRIGLILLPIRTSTGGNLRISIRILRRDLVEMMSQSHSGSTRGKMSIVEATSRDRIENIEKLNRITMRNFQYIPPRTHQREEQTLQCRTLFLMPSNSSNKNKENTSRPNLMNSHHAKDTNGKTTVERA